ncbi:CoaE-domain-containing protein [Dothidotthia symphoricarpi CBS 119687]|uniref:CoaE-domain-containing protein n=1 Tax=Dothidotthia symphoricarpi CBS 119687 TaxID=1392245 RepID=A0A6A6A0K8_9PLEO|nr:CoaE-domain-containing protein [Dothidotthia symphoricarpi CBS 119687]KAF2125350.1 CoaE-domain-containing protein [Dothidotthia symphoricarpi CBS 119687]
MLLLGLTGSIATGKSTVSTLLSRAPYSLPIIDADLIARQVVEPGTAGYTAIVQHFLPSTPDLLLPDATPRGRPLNRPALGRRVFGSGADKERDRKTLNGIVHPAVRKEMYRQMVWAYLRGNWAVVLDVPLLFESGWERYCGSILVVGVSDPGIQIQRLRARDAHLTEEDARNRVVSQGDVREKAERALRRGKGRGVVVWNDGGREELEGQIQGVMRDLRSGSPRWWSTLLWVCPPLGAVAGLWSWYRMRGVQLKWEEEKKREKSKL